VEVGPTQTGPMMAGPVRTEMTEGNSFRAMRTSPRGRRRPLSTVLVAALVMTLVATVPSLALSLAMAPTSAAASASTPACAVVGASVPSCGRWWGEALDPVGESLLTAVSAAQASTQRRLDIVHTYHRWDDAFPTAEETTLARRGHLLLIGWKPVTLSGSLVTWSSIAAGQQDLVIEAEAAHLAALRVPVFLSFSYEPEKLVGTAGTAAEFAAAYRHVHDVMVRAGATNIRWVWTVMGLDSAHWHQAYQQLWPGSGYVDWIAWDPYNWSSCRGEPSVSFSGMVGPFYRWVTSQHFGRLPLMLAEYGTTETAADGTADAAWYSGESDALSAFPRLDALVYFNLPSPPASCDWLSTASPSSAQAFASLARGPAFRSTASLDPTSS